MPLPNKAAEQFRKLLARADRADRAEGDRRDLAFLFEAPRTLCGVRVQPLTLRKTIYLFLARSPFLTGRPVRSEDVVQFVHILSPDFATGNSRAQRAARHRFIDRIATRQRFASAVRAIHAFVDDAWADQPPAAGSKSGSSFRAWAAAMVHEFAWAYSWEIDYILDTPIAALHLLCRFIAREHNPNLPTFSSKADKMKGDFLRRFNAKAKSPDARKRRRRSGKESR